MRLINIEIQKIQILKKILFLKMVLIDLRKNIKVRWSQLYLEEPQKIITVIGYLTQFLD